MAYKRNVEIFEEAYEKKDAKSVVSYVARDGRKRYIAGSKSPSGSDVEDIVKSMETNEVTWAELKSLRDNSQLLPGSLYRITDYNCTTTQENTQSAGHQFDIVLLALSEGKLAEEGWAMMNESNVYDVTYTPGVGQEPVTAKGYLYNYLSPEDPEYSIVLCDTLKGVSGLDGSEFTIDEENKTIVFNSDFYASMNVKNLPYNYFQNSNLSAWKVWYCLDNDKSRFAWADDRESSPEHTLYEWGSGYYTESDNPSPNDPIWWFNGTTYEPKGSQWYVWQVHTEDGNVTSIDIMGNKIDIMGNKGEIMGLTNTGTTLVPAFDGGKGVIYRLIDEFNNDVAYDFKNILINDNGKADYYTFSGLLNTEIIDCSMLYTSNPAVHIASNNTICRSFMRDKQYINGVFIYDEDNVGFGDMKISSTAIGQFQPRTGCLVNYSFYEEEEEPSQGKVV